MSGVIDDWRGMQKLMRSETGGWTNRFPDKFCEEIYRLHGWPWPGMRKNRRQIVGHYMNDLVWDRFAPGLRQAFVLRIPRRPDGNHAVLMHQALTEEVGIVELQHHIALLLLIMGKQSEWVRFMFVANQALPKSGRDLTPPRSDRKAAKVNSICSSGSN